MYRLGAFVLGLSLALPFSAFAQSYDSCGELSVQVDNITDSIHFLADYQGGVSEMTVENMSLEDPSESSSAADPTYSWDFFNTETTVEIALNKTDNGVTSIVFKAIIYKPNHPTHAGWVKIIRNGATSYYTQEFLLTVLKIVLPCI